MGNSVLIGLLNASNNGQPNPTWTEELTLIPYSEVCRSISLISLALVLMRPFWGRSRYILEKFVDTKSSCPQSTFLSLPH
jgi:hypothetical protein